MRYYGDMMFTRSLKRIISVALLGVLLSAQMAVAAYVCPAQMAQMGRTSEMPQTASGLSTTMPGCDMGSDGAAMDPDAPGLCHATCYAAGQSDQTPTLKLPVATLHSLPFVLMLSPLAEPGRTLPVRPLWSVAAAPPLSVLYCCFRI